MGKYVFQVINLNDDTSRWAKTCEILTTLIDEMVMNGLQLVDIVIQPFLEEDHDILASGDIICDEDLPKEN